MRRFINREQAGAQLAAALVPFQNNLDAIVYAVPRGGVVVGAAVARFLRLSLDLIVARKIGHPANPEFAICAVTENGEPVCHEDASGVDAAWLAVAIAREREEAKRRRLRYLGDEAVQGARKKIAIIVDDGIATGLTMQAAIRELQSEEPVEVVVAVPVAASDALRALRDVDEVVALEEDDPFLGSVGAYYDDFSQVSDDEVVALLAAYKRHFAS